MSNNGRTSQLITSYIRVFSLWAICVLVLSEPKELGADLAGLQRLREAFAFVMLIYRPLPWRAIREGQRLTWNEDKNFFPRLFYVSWR